MFHISGKGGRKDTKPPPAKRPKLDAAAPVKEPEKAKPTAKRPAESSSSDDSSSSEEDDDAEGKQAVAVKPTPAVKPAAAVKRPLRNLVHPTAKTQADARGLTKSTINAARYDELFDVQFVLEHF